MRVLFLDIDGVLNSHHWYENRPSEPHNGRGDELVSMIDPDAVARLNQIVEATGCVVVLSSSWRCMDPIGRIDRALNRRGFNTRLFGATPNIGNPRGSEIIAWLELVPGTVESFAILDDDSDMADVSHALIQTDYKTGLLDDHAKRAIAKLCEAP